MWNGDQMDARAVLAACVLRAAPSDFRASILRCLEVLLSGVQKSPCAWLTRGGASLPDG